MIEAKNWALAGGITWGFSMFVLTLISVWTGYAAGLLNLFAGLYIGYSISYVGSIIGLVYGFLDAFIGIWIFIWIYNKLAKK